MTEQDVSSHGPAPRGGVYRISVEGRLDADWSDWFSGMTVAEGIARDGTPVTTLCGPIRDQAALRGILARLWDLNLTVVALARVESEMPLQEVGP